MKNRALIFAACFMVSTAAIAQQDSTKKFVQVPDNFTSKLDVVYTTGGTWEGRMDLYLPKSDSLASIVINIHGGGWNHGTKEEQTGFASFFKNKMAVANVEYRLTPQATAPAAIEDVRCALIYITEHAKELQIDPEKIIIMGGSAGAHLALMAGMLANDHRFDGNCMTTAKISVAAIIDKYGITDVWDWGYGTNITSKSAVNWLGKYKSDEAFAHSVSPISYVSAQNPPTLIIHGDADPVVPYQQSVALHEKMKAAGVNTTFISVPGGQHGKFEKETNSSLNKQIIAFINQQINTK